MSDGPEKNWIAETIVKMRTMKANVMNTLTGSEGKSEEEEKVNEMAEIIKTYRGVVDEEEDESGKPWVDRSAFDVIMSAIIVMNMIVIALETDFDSDPDNRGPLWIVLETVFVILFVVEIVLKVKEHGPKWLCGTAMNFLCTIIAAMAVFDLLILYPLRATGKIKFQGVLRMVSLLRIVGLLRLVRIIRMYRALEELRLVIQGLVDSFQTIAWVVILITVFLYICSVIVTKEIGKNVEVYGDYKALSGGWDHEELFGTVGRSMYTLLQVMTLDGWSSRVARHVITNQPFMSVFFLVFLLFSTHGLLNIVVSVIVEHTLSTAEKNEARMKVREERARKQELGSINEIFVLSDVDGSGGLDLEEFLSAVQNPEVQWRLRQLELPVGDAARLFDILDGEGTRSLSMKEFIAGCTKLKGIAQSKDLLAIQAQADTLARKMETLGDKLVEGERMMGALDEVTQRIKRRFSSAVRGTRQKLAHTKGGTEPVVLPKRTRPGAQEEIDLSIGNRPALPNFPNLLN
jgi:voltage-gated sodium channel